LDLGFCHSLVDGEALVTVVVEVEIDITEVRDGVREETSSKYGCLVGVASHYRRVVGAAEAKWREGEGLRG
jgi:hypothetical protein